MAGSLWVLIPAYVANAAATLPKGWGAKMDLGRVWRDGRPILGSSKSWSGFLAGSVIGFIIGMMEEMLVLVAPPSLQIVPVFSDSLLLAVPTLVGLTFGALSGDALGSFVKRRIGVRSGERAPLLDQLPFILLPMLLILLLNPPLFVAAFWPGPELGAFILAWVTLLTLGLHSGFNWVGYFAGLKKVPW